MFRKTFIFILLITLAGVAAYGQQGKGSVTTTAPKAEGQNFIYSFGNGSYIGVQIDEVNKENMAKYGLREVRGVAIEKVLDDSPAKAAGLQNGDVIIKFNGEDVTSERKLVRLLSEVAPDHQANLKIIRGGDEREVTVTVGKRPGLKFDNGVWAAQAGQFGKFEMPKMPKIPNMKEWKMGDLSAGGFAWAGSGRYIGASLMSLSKQLGDYFGVADGKGMLITSVKENSPAAKAGLKAGDVIVEVDGKEISADNSLFTVLHDKKEGDITLTVVRDRNRQTFNVTPEERKVGELFEGVEPGIYKALAPLAATKALEELRYLTPPAPPIAPHAPMAPLPASRVLMPTRVL